VKKLITLIAFFNLYADELIWNESKIENLPLFSSVQAKNKKTETKQLLSDFGKEMKKELKVKATPKQNTPAEKPATANNSKQDCPNPYTQKSLVSPYSSKDLNSKKLSLNLSESATIAEAIEIISKLSSIDIFVDQSVTGSFGKQIFKDKTVGQILKHLLPYSNPPLTLIQDSGGYQVVEETKAKDIISKTRNQLDTQTFILENADPGTKLKEEILSYWKIIIAGDKCADLSIQETKIFARGRKDQLKQLASFLSQIDVPTTQVKIDFVIAATDKQFGLDFGINWSGIYNRHQSIIKNKTPFGLAGLGGVVKDTPTPTEPLSETLGNLFVDPTNLAVNLSNNVFSNLLNASLGGNTITVPIVFGGPDLNLSRLNLMINAAEAEYKLKVFQRPTMVTLDKETVTIMLGRNIPIITNIQDSVENTVRTVSTFNYKETGVNISVTPVISPDKKSVSLDIFIEDSEMTSGSTKVTATGIMQDPPVFEVLKMKNRIQLNNQQTVIIGGLSRSSEVESKRNVPIISKVPVFGGLFKSSSRAHQNTENFIFITPTIITK
jgi:type II secretory pathway component GspD/PulD (secretin)